jgi:hypothetical protein
MARLTKCTEVVRHTFTTEDRLRMTEELCQAHGEEETIETDWKVVKTQFDTRRATIAARTGQLFANLQAGFEMRHTICDIFYDVPNVAEVSYIRQDNGELVRVRPMTEAERQAELDFATSQNPAVGETLPVEESAGNVTEFFEKEAAAPEEAEAAGAESEEEPEKEEEEEETVVEEVAAPRTSGRRR